MEARTESRRQTTSRPRARVQKKPARAAAKQDAQAQDPEAAMMAAWQKAMTPAKGHERLAPLAGTFNVSLRMWMQPGAPPMEGGGKSVQKWILGGRYLQQTYRGTAMGRPFQGLGYTGFDNVTQKYVGNWMDNMGTGLMNSVGIGNPTAKKIEFEGSMADPMTGKECKVRSVIRIKDQDRHTFEMFGPGPDGKEFRTMLIEYTRAWLAGLAPDGARPEARPGPRAAPGRRGAGPPQTVRRRRRPRGLAQHRGSSIVPERCAPPRPPCAPRLGRRAPPRPGPAAMVEPGAAFRTVVGESRAEIPKVKRSRFIATVTPLAAPEGLDARVERLRAEFPVANHHCWAYRLGPAGETFRYSDDGEPSGSAGRPILQRLDGLRLTDTLVVVTRIFGGTKLGVGGLIRAYGAAAALGLAGATIRTLVPVRRVRLSFPIALSRRVEAILHAADVHPLETSYGASVEMRLEIPVERASGLLDELRERSAGRLSVEDLA